VVGAQLFLVLGLVALIVAAVGIYSVASYTMSQRANEIGIRIALGAKNSDIFKLAARGSLTVLGIGAVLGVVTAVALGRFVASLLFGVTTTDGISLAGAALLLVTLGVVASLVPAWRASQIDPVQTLKAE
jgi:ABC-type antimicrobial peptide transport system permease subunit